MPAPRVVRALSGLSVDPEARPAELGAGMILALMADDEKRQGK